MLWTPETIDIQSSLAIRRIANSLANRCFLISPAYYGAFQANISDGKSDGKNILSILRPKITVRKNSGRRESL
jgi:hypothetical protein